MDGDGPPWNPTIKTVTVAKVLPGSPAEQAGIVVGDEIVEVEGRPVAGAKARDLQGHLQLEAGKAVKLVVKKPSGERRPLSLVAAAKPA